MAVRSTTLSTILGRMQRWQSVARVEEQYLVQDLDDALRTIRREIRFPWTLIKSSIRVFDGVLEYPVAVDHDELAYIDNLYDSLSGEDSYYDRARFRFTSLKQFYQNVDYRNDLAEIWDNNERFLGIRYTPRKTESRQLDGAEAVTGYTGSDDAGTPVKDTVVFKEGNASVRIPITSSSGTATIEKTLDNSFSDSNYKRKYFFLWFYLDAVPTSLELRFGNDSSNYLSESGITTQFSGQALKADQWNLLAFDLGTATETGTLDSSAFDYLAIVLTGAATGTYYIDSSYAREWELLDYWYYSIYNVMTESAVVGDQEFLINDSGIYSTSNKLIGDKEWVDLVMYTALMNSAGDQENSVVFQLFERKASAAMDALESNYPDLKPVITTLRYRFLTDLNDEEPTA